MRSAHRLRNPIQNYAWGSRDALADLLGRPAPSAEPEAELWMGAHPAAPSEVEVDGRWVSLADWMARDPAAVLGEETARRFDGELPFLFKVLAAASPLSVQAHPDAAQAAAGFARENAAGIALDAPQRCYRDPRAKPELVCALTPFAALCGFRSPAEVLDQVDELRAHRLAVLAAPLRTGRDGALRELYAAVMALDASAAAAVLDDVLAAAETGNGDPTVRGWLRKLAL